MPRRRDHACGSRNRYINRPGIPYPRWKAQVAGTGLTVRRIVGWYKMGMSPKDIALEYPHLSLAQVHAALAYYHANRDEIESDIAAEELLNDDWARPVA
ncbi:MAG TPA: DUF433 domain-containing protein [Bryobacteraceae bacterium]